MSREKWNNNWRVWRDENAFELIFIVPEDAITVNLPYDALLQESQKEESINQGRTGYLDAGVYNYYKEFFVPISDEDKRIQIEFEGIFTKSFIYVNGNFVGECDYPYQDFFVDITDYLHLGVNNSILVIANAMNLSSRYYTGAGIFRDVYFWKIENLHIQPESVKVTTLDIDEEGACIEIEAELGNNSVKAESIDLQIKVEQEGKTFFQGSWPQRITGLSTKHFQKKIYLEKIGLWSEESPHMCAVTAELMQAGIVRDKEKITTGIRKIRIDSKFGLRINGKETKLRGACIHHDQGLLGASTYYDYEYRRILKLKEAGFNAVRSAHNPASRALLEACDRLGVYVMDEAFDMWNKMKNYADYSLFFEKGYSEVIEAMVRVDYNHPSVILYSTGNEISNIGTWKGYETSRQLSELFHKLDKTRFTTNGINGLFAAGNRLDEMLRDIQGEAFKGLKKGDINTCMTQVGADMNKLVLHSAVGEILEELDSTMDVLGYNYMTSRYLSDHEKYPQRVMLGTETFPPQIAENWNIIKKCPAVIGDFTWTGYSYLGEVGDYPMLINYNAGDLSVTAQRRPVSYYREIVYGRREKPYATVVFPDEEIRIGNPWEFTKGIPCWDYPGREGERVQIEAYSAGDKVSLYINEKFIEEKQNTENYMVVFDAEYQPGAVRIISYKNETILGEYVMKTPGKDRKIQALVERYDNCEQGAGLVFVTFKLVDQDGVLLYNTEDFLELSLKGKGTLLAFGSAASSHSKGYCSYKTKTDGGTALAIIKPEGTVEIEVSSSTLGSCEVLVEA